MNLDTLPDDELLLVLGFLDARDLLLCRGVCRRLRDMALHPHLWRKIHLSSYAGVQLCAAVLRLVPCLGFLRLGTEYNKVPKYLRLGTLLVTTNCAISNLQVDIALQSAVVLAMTLSRQAALGRLTSVSLTSEITNKTPELRLLIDQLLHTPGLTSLAVTTDSDEDVPLGFSLPKAAKGDAVPASLRRLEMDFTDCTLPQYLKWHADTLEVVQLDFSVVPAGTAALLGSLPRLQELKCPMMEDMPALLQCPALKTLYLSVEVDEETRPFLPGAHKFLSRAAGRLENLTLRYVEEEELPNKTRVCASAVNLVLSLAGPGSSVPSALRSLSLAYWDCGDAWDPQSQLLPLASVLHRLENLVTLNLGGPPTPHFLEALDGCVLPRLERLRIYIRDDGSQGCCPHEWVHGAEPRDLVSRYPRLHLEVDPRHERGCKDCNYAGCDECKCPYCVENTCHDFDSIVHTLFTHPEEEVCNQKHGQVGVRIEL